MKGCVQLDHTSPLVLLACWVYNSGFVLQLCIASKAQYYPPTSIDDPNIVTLCWYDWNIAVAAGKRNKLSIPIDY
jgi:hypothetical protein